MSSLWAWTAVGNWLLCKDVGAEHLCSHCSQDQLWERWVARASWELQIFRVFRKQESCFLGETSLAFCWRPAFPEVSDNAGLDKNEGLDENQIRGLEGIQE